MFVCESRLMDLLIHRAVRLQDQNGHNGAVLCHLDKGLKRVRLRHNGAVLCHLDKEVIGSV